MKNFERLKAWAACHELVLGVYGVTKSFPGHERFGLTSQLRRAATSAATNIAEGAAKRSKKEFARFLDVALGSLSECDYLIQLAGELAYIPKTTAAELEIKRDHANQLTWGLYQATRRRAVTR